MQTDLRLVAVGKITQDFVVPSYQRGYRWGADEVIALLDDIAAIKEKDDKDYCLQPVVVKRLNDGRYELVDGQQRLTTLYLIFLFMQKEGFKKYPPPFTLAYETREDSGKFLRDLDPARAEENIDFSHLWNAFRLIQDWFTQRGNDAEAVVTQIYLHLHNRVKVIWYEPAPDVESTALFTRLNIGRIPLTPAELVKALLLKASGEAGAASLRRIEMGMQWDVIERELHDERLWRFLTNRAPADYPTRIELLFDLMVEPNPSDRFHIFHHFKGLIEEGRTAEDIWNDVLARHDLVKEWYKDGNLYHHIGYLVDTGKGDDDLRTLIRESATKTKTELRDSLHRKIVDRLNLTREMVDDLEYDHDYRRCYRALLLFNVESTRRLGDSFERYPFYVHKRHRWSLEHIHAQNAEALVKKEQWQEWLREHAMALERLRDFPTDTARDEAHGLAHEMKASVADVTKETFTALSARVIALLNRFDAADEPHAIDNLALLPGDLNSALSNAVFEVKRQRVLKMDRDGEYIPICTRRVFLKYYTASADQHLQIWSRSDRIAYFEAMFSEREGVLTAYLKKTP